MKDLKLKIYSTSSSRFFEKETEKAVNIINERIKNANICSVEHERVKFSSLEPRLTGKKKVDWDWFVENFTSKTDADIVVFHFSRRDRRRWKMNPRVNGTYRNDKDNRLEFWLSANNRQKARGYRPRISEFYRIFIHEFLHGCYRWTGVNTNLVHHFDYDCKKVDAGLVIVDFNKVKK
jgi:hypothetical protein